ncbi:MAG: alcohol dehydrogenase catalytic domain-containing protein [Proteobacteria bacterium]|nr:alcohol dehydrogenase catalytic domain-containing protein [Pseudomonadota bacterium]MBU2261947.1 alcohol dehydrogenase catalytic domain-containing protein [Pseudomonadota bacterium]
MQAALLVEPGKIEIREVPIPSPREDEVLVRVREAGICGTDYALYRGELNVSYPLIPGHEAVGEIAAMGKEVKGLHIGERVVIQPNFPCTACPVCLSGRGNICPRKVRLGLDVNGVFAQYVCVPAPYVWPLPEGLSVSEAALAEPLSVALHAFRKSQPVPDEKVLVYGTGVIGLFLIRLAAIAGAKVGAVDIAEQRLAVAKELGADAIYRSAAEVEKNAGSFSIFFDASGVADAFSNIVNIAAPGGRIVLTGLPHKEFPLLTSMIVRKELTIQGSMIYTDEFPAALDLLKQGNMKIERLITETCPLKELARALEGFSSPERIKTLIRIP